MEGRWLPLTLVLDTSALWHPPLTTRILEMRERTVHQVRFVLPGVAYAERRRQLLRDGRDVGVWDEDLRRARIEVEAFGPTEAARIRAVNDDLWEKHARDYLVAAHVGPGRVAVTYDEGPAWRDVPLIDPETAADFLASILDGPGWVQPRAP